MTTHDEFPGMTPKRYFALLGSRAALTAEETRMGWHYCPDWDYLLIHRDDPEAGACRCGAIKRSPYDKEH